MRCHATWNHRVRSDQDAANAPCLRKIYVADHVRVECREEHGRTCPSTDRAAHEGVVDHGLGNITLLAMRDELCICRKQVEGCPVDHQIAFRRWDHDRMRCTLLKGGNERCGWADNGCPWRQRGGRSEVILTSLREPQLSNCCGCEKHDAHETRRSDQEESVHTNRSQIDEQTI